MSLNPVWFVPPSLEEQIFSADIIVRAYLVSVTPTAKTVASDEEGSADTYRATQELRFKIHEYLKGEGFDQIVVLVGDDDTCPTAAQAQQEADISVRYRNTTWDGRESVLFLRTPRVSPESDGAHAGEEAGDPDSEMTAFFVRSNPFESPWDYSVDTLSRAWLPAWDAADAVNPSQLESPSSSGAGLAFITDGSASPLPVIALTDLRTKIADMEAELEAGKGIEGYLACIKEKIKRERVYRANGPWNPSRFEKSVTSGSGSLTEIYRETSDHGVHAYYKEEMYHNFWLSGPDAEVFKFVIIDDDSDPYNGYKGMLVTTRPLPSGTYYFRDNIQHYKYIPCDFKPDNAYDAWTVTVTAPAGTVHEAFFDPVTLTGIGVGADTTANGELSPASFTIGDADSALQSLTWQGGSVVLTLSPYASLAGNAIDFIELDGSVSLTLSVDAATVDSAAGTLTWSVATQPWHDGDLLMLRIRNATVPAQNPVPTVEPTVEPTIVPTAEPTAIPTPEPTVNVSTG